MPRGYTRQFMGSYQIATNGAPSGTYSSQSSFESLTRSDIIEGVKVTKGAFRPPNPYFMDFFYEDGPHGEWTFKSYGYDMKYTGALRSVCYLSDWPGRAAPDPPAHVENALIIKALNDVKDQKANLRVALSEVQDVADMIADNATRIAKGLRHLKRGRFREAFRAIRHRPRRGWDVELSSRILEFQYGVRPLVADIHGSMEALANARYGTEKNFIITGKGRAKGGGDVSSTFVSNRSGYLPVKVSTREQWEVKVRLHYECTDLRLKTASELGFTNPLATAWELLPFSCVVDWVYPAGDWLNAMDATLGLTYRGGSCTEWSTANNSYSGVNTANNGKSTLTGESRVRRHRRTVYVQSPVPDAPRVKNPVSKEHALNAIALLTSVFRDGDFNPGRVR